MPAVAESLVNRAANRLWPRRSSRSRQPESFVSCAPHRCRRRRRADDAPPRRRNDQTDRERTPTRRARGNGPASRAPARISKREKDVAALRHLSPHVAETPPVLFCSARLHSAGRPWHQPTAPSMDCTVRVRIRNPSPAVPHFSGEGRRRQASRVSFRLMASATPVEEPAAAAVEAKPRPSGASFIRHHLRSLAAYQPILPFEVSLSVQRLDSPVPWSERCSTFRCACEVLVEMSRGDVLVFLE